MLRTASWTTTQEIQNTNLKHKYLKQRSYIPILVAKNAFPSNALLRVGAGREFQSSAWFKKDTPLYTSSFSDGCAPNDKAKEEPGYSTSGAKCNSWFLLAEIQHRVAVIGGFWPLSIGYFQEDVFQWSSWKKNYPRLESCQK